MLYFIIYLFICTFILATVLILAKKGYLGDIEKEALEGEESEYFTLVISYIIVCYTFPILIFGALILTIFDKLIPNKKQKNDNQ